jgi:hypothetical protein
MDAEELWGRLSALPAHIQRWLRVDRAQALEDVIGRTLGAFAAADSPDQREGRANGLDFLRALNAEGGDNPLWQVGMDQLDGEIYSAVAELDGDTQVALLLPWVDDLDGLATDRDADDWAEVLRQQATSEWSPVLRRIVLSRL